MLHLRRSRARARDLAAAEAVALLDGLEPVVESGGPLAERGGVLWVSVASHAVDDVARRAPRFGYTSAVDLVVHWHKRDTELVRLFEEDARIAREEAVDRREFTIATGAGPRAVRGYRGTGSVLGRRGLAVADARLLVNLALPGGRGLVIDPFAGAGGIVAAATAHEDARAFSADVDPVVAPGLSALSSRHVIADARALPLCARTFDAIATEPPFDESADDSVTASLPELARAVRLGGRIAIMCPERQAVQLRATAPTCALEPVLDMRLDRRGLAMTVLAWHR